MKTLKRLFNYLKRDIVDLIMFTLTLMFAVLSVIKTPDMSLMFKNGNFSLWLFAAALFILGSAIWTKGTMTDIMKEYIKDPDARRKLYLDPMKLTPYDKVVTGFFHILFFIALIVMFILLLNE